MPSTIELPHSLRSKTAQRQMLATLAEAEPGDLTRLMSRWSVDDLSSVGSGLIDFYARLEETKTDVLKAIAKVVVVLRSKFRTPDGDVDWGGRSWEYRTTVTEMYERAGIPPDSEQNVQASLRYHVGNLLRDVVDPHELEAVGLRTDSPKERTNAQRLEARALPGGAGCTDGKPPPGRLDPAGSGSGGAGPPYAVGC